MEWMIWGFAGLSLVVVAIFGIALWIVFRRDRDLPNQGLDMRQRQRLARLSRNIPKGVPKTR